MNPITTTGTRAVGRDAPVAVRVVAGVRTGKPERPTEMVDRSRFPVVRGEEDRARTLLGGQRLDHVGDHVP